MKGKQLGILVVAAAVLGGLGWYVRQQGAQAPEKARIGMGEKLLGNFDVNTVKAIRLVAGTNAVNVALGGDNWVVKERGGYPANFTTVAEFVRKLGDLKITKPLSKTSIDLCVDLDGATPTDHLCAASTPANKPWLQWKWSGLTFDKDPNARATFGVFKNADELIYLRENF